jgi:hypothetical protein
LPTVVYRKGLAIFVKFVRYAKAGLEFIVCFLERGGMYKHHISMETKFASNEACQCGNNPIIAGSSIIVKVNEGLTSGIAISFFIPSMKAGIKAL